jgi:putative transposase
VQWNAINKYGIKLNKRTYDCKALNPYRRQHSGVEWKKGLWEVHYDPYDVTRIWVRNHHNGGWITVPWKHLRSTPAPFGELAWQHARTVLARRGQDTATEAEIAEAAAALLDKAERGPDAERDMSKRDRRVAGRTRATNTPTGPRPSSPPDDEQESPAPQPDEHDEAEESMAEVIPLPVFDARKEAEQWQF